MASCRARIATSNATADRSKRDFWPPVRRSVPPVAVPAGARRSVGADADACSFARDDAFGLVCAAKGSKGLLRLTAISATKRCRHPSRCDAAAAPLPVPAAAPVPAPVPVPVRVLAWPPPGPCSFFILYMSKNNELSWLKLVAASRLSMPEPSIWSTPRRVFSAANRRSNRVYVFLAFCNRPSSQSRSRSTDCMEMVNARSFCRMTSFCSSRCTDSALRRSCSSCSCFIFMARVSSVSKMCTFSRSKNNSFWTSCMWLSYA
jgi:hypothetical protein